MPNELRVVIADDHQLMREGFKALLNKHKSGLQIIGEARNGRELLELCKELKPDVVFTDIQMPEMDGIEACKAIKLQNKKIGIIALSTFDEEHLIADMLNAGASGYLLKNTNPTEVAKAAKAVSIGGSYFCSEVAQKVNNIMTSIIASKKQKEKIDFSEREKEIIKLICEEFSNKEIANKLKLSPRTVEGHKDRIQLKIGTNKIAGIITYAIKHNIYKL